MTGRMTTKGRPTGLANRDLPGPVRPGIGSLAAEPGGDAPARRRAAGAPAPDRPPRGRRRGRRPLRLPGRPVAAAGRDPAELPDDRLRDERGGSRRDPAAKRAPSRDHGPGYAARDPELSLWVHATLVDSTIAVADAWLEPVSRDRRAAFYAETRPIGRAFGVPEALCRRTSRRSRRMSRACSRRRGRSGCRRSRASWRGSCCGRRSGRWRPGCRVPGRVGRRRPYRGRYAWTLWPSVGLLPETVRDDYGLRWGRSRAGRRGVAGDRLARLAPLLPASFRQMPKARRRTAGWPPGPDRRPARPGRGPSALRTIPGGLIGRSRRP